MCGRVDRSPCQWMKRRSIEDELTIPSNLEDELLSLHVKQAKEAMEEPHGDMIPSRQTQ